MPNKNNSSNIKNEKHYEALRDMDYNKQIAARIANTKDSGKKAEKAKNTKSGQKKIFTKRLVSLELNAEAR